MGEWGSYGTDRRHYFVAQQPCPFTRVSGGFKALCGRRESKIFTGYGVGDLPRCKKCLELAPSHTGEG